MRTPEQAFEDIKLKTDFHWEDKLKKALSEELDNIIQFRHILLADQAIALNTFNSIVTKLIPQLMKTSFDAGVSIAAKVTLEELLNEIENEK